MSIALSQITNDNTFGIWKDRTNSIITGLATVVTLGDTASTNTGNIALTGNVTAGGFVKTDTLDALGSGNLITTNANFKLNGDLQINKSGQVALGFYNSGALTWNFTTSADHTDLLIQTGSGSGAKNLKIDSTGVNSATALLTGQNLKIDNSILPTTLTQNTSGNAATATTLATARAIAIAGDVVGTANFDGSGDISITAAVANNSHTHTSANITDLSTTLSSYATLSGAVFTGDVQVSNGEYIYFGDHNDNTDGYAAVRYGSFGGGPRIFSISLADGTVSDVGSMIINLDGKNMTINNGLDSKLSINGSSGSLVTEGDITAFGSVSDRNRKENIVKIDNALDKVSQISGYTFNYIGDDTPMTGVIAQELEEVLPEVVYETESPDGTQSKAVRHGNIVGLLIESIKELKAEIEELKKDK